jgi:Flp pilus assembly protein TadG
MYPRDRSGSTALEFAFVVWPFLVLVFAIFDLGHYMMAQHELRTLVGEVARSVVISCGSNNYEKLSASCTANPLTTAQEQAIAPILFAGGASPTITVTPESGTIAVTASMSTFPTILPWWDDLVGELSATTNLYY